MRTRTITSPLLVAAGLCVACSSTPSVEPEPAAPIAPATTPSPATSGDEYVFVFLKVGPQSGKLPPEVEQEAGSGHFANMARLADEGELLLAGPFGEPKVDRANSGVFVFDARTVAEADALTATDPAVRAGVFVFDAYPLRSSSPLRRALDVLRAAEARGDLSRDDPGRGIRPYFLAIARDGDAADEALAPLADEGLVLFSGRFGGALEGASIHALIADSLRDAHEMLAFAAPDGTTEWDVHPWWSSSVLLELVD